MDWLRKASLKSCHLCWDLSGIKKPTREICGIRALQVKETSIAQAKGRKELDSFKEHHKERCSWNVEKVVWDKLGEVSRGQSLQGFELALGSYLWDKFVMYLKHDEKPVWRFFREGSNVMWFIVKRFVPPVMWCMGHRAWGAGLVAEDTCVVMQEGMTIVLAKVV